MRLEDLPDKLPCWVEWHGRRENAATSNCDPSVDMVGPLELVAVLEPGVPWLRPQMKAFEHGACLLLADGKGYSHMDFYGTRYIKRAAICEENDEFPNGNVFVRLSDLTLFKPYPFDLSKELLAKRTIYI